MSAVLARLSALSVTYRTDEGPALALENVDLDILSGERLAIIGESGSGKSTLALALAGILPDTARLVGKIDWPSFVVPSEPMTIENTPTPNPSPQGGGRLAGNPAASKSSMMLRGTTGQESPSPLWGSEGRARQVTRPGRGGGTGESRIGGTRASGDVVPLPGRDIGFVFQDAGASLNPVLTIGEQIAEVAKRHLSMGWPDAYRHALDLLGRVRIPQPQAALKAYPHQLSGGQRQRVAIASAIAARPRLLIADEPTSALDMVVQAEIVALLDTLVREDGMTLLFITHDIALASGFADRIAVFRKARLVEAGPTQALLSNPADAYTRSLIAGHIDLATPPLIAETA